MKTFYQFEIIIHFFVSVAMFIISVFMFDIQIIAGIVLMTISLFFLLYCFLVIVKIDIYNDRLIVHKLLRKSNIFFQDINRLTVENRHFIGEGRWSKRQAIVITYIENSGYGDELVLTYNDNLYHYFRKILGDIYER